ncbi:MAG TPA: hypothetical protein VIL12_06525 [Acidimicrobiia bacterium]
MDEARRNIIGILGLLLGAVLVFIGIIWTHFSSLPETEVIGGVEVAVDSGIFQFIPRGFIIGDTSGGLPWFTLGHLVAIVGSQLMVVGALFFWVVGRQMTWPRAAFAAFVTWIELVLVFGTIPSEWLNLSQGPLAWTSQRIAITVPTWLVLGQEVQVSYAVLKDAISAGYSTTMLVAAVVSAYLIQGFGHPKPPKKGPIGTSPYGRPLVKGS